MIFSIGFFEIAIVSMELPHLRHQAIDNLSAAQPLVDRLLTGVVIRAVYPIYLCFRFSGHVDVEIGVARFDAACIGRLTFMFFAIGLFWFWSTWTEMDLIVVALGWGTALAVITV